MSRGHSRLSLWALAWLCSLASSLADGNIGCLFSSSLCINGAEWCYDDFAFGKCIPLYQDEPEDGALFQYDMSNDQLKWFEAELQQLVGRGYRWEHAYTQCVLQAMLYTLRQKLDVSKINIEICANFADPALISDSEGEINETEEEVVPDETAFVRFTPNSPIRDTDFANEVYSPPLEEDSNTLNDNAYFVKGDEKIRDVGERNKLRDLLYMTGGVSPVAAPFEGFRERIQAEIKAKSKHNDMANDKEKKSMPELEIEENEANDEERLGAHYRKHKAKVPPFSTEYITGNRYSPLGNEVSNALSVKYKESFAAKHFPFEYENPDNEIPEPRIYYGDDGLEDFNLEPGSGELDGINPKVLQNAEDSVNRRYLMNLFRVLDSDKYVPFQAEGGPVGINSEEGDNSKITSGDLQRLFYPNGLGFMRRERDDVKKPGPRLDAKALKFLYKNVTEAEKTSNSENQANGLDFWKSDFDYDPSYTFVVFKNRFGTDWNKGIEFIRKVEELVGLKKNTFTNPRVDPEEVTFKVEKNEKGLEAIDVAAEIGLLKEELRRQTGAQISTAGIGDNKKFAIIADVEENNDEGVFLGLELPVFLALVGSLAVLLVASAIFALLLRRDIYSKRKMHGLSTAAEIDAEATRDYQELCRARMSGKWTGQAPAHPVDNSQRITSLSRDGEPNNSPSTRSSTSSWSEEPALTNMDISTGHMVLNYMEDHLHNKDRLEQEWQALCAYEAEPCTTSAALKPENTKKNRYTDILPYDHSRVTLNTVTNHLGSDYINASTISDHDPRNPAYIAAAGPLAHTAPDFWQLVWEQGSVVMVMLTRLTENGQQLCHRYWPEEGSELYHIYEVHLVSEHIWCDDYLVRSFYLKNQRTGETRTVTQFHFLSWPENGVPSSSKALLEFRRKVNKSYRGRSCPIVVHCSDGAGRTGTYCLIDMVLNRMAKGAKEIDIAATLEHIRDQRPRTVATRQQFEFVLTAVAAEVHAILKAHTAHIQQMQEKKEKEKDKDGNEKSN